MGSPIYTNNTSTSLSNSTLTWVGDVSNSIAGSGYGGITTTSSTYPSQPKIDIKRCRNCSHAHLEEQTGCIDQEGWNTIFVVCPCKEYLPTDNLEYLEHLYKKKENK